MQTSRQLYIKCSKGQIAEHSIDRTNSKCFFHDVHISLGISHLLVYFTHIDPCLEDSFYDGRKNDALPANSEMAHIPDEHRTISPHDTCVSGQ